MADMPNMTVKVGIETINMNREQATRAEAVMVAAEVLREWTAERPMAGKGSKPGVATDIMSVADYIVSGFADEDDGPYEFVFTPEGDGAAEPSVPEDGESEDMERGGIEL